MATQDERLAALEEFVGAVVFGYLEMHEYNEVGQCPWCMWVPGRDWDPVHDCPAKTFAADPIIRDAWEKLEAQDE